MKSIKEEVTHFKNHTKELIDTIKLQVTVFLKFTIKHYLMLSSFLVFLFSILCYNRTTTYFDGWGINFFDYASFSDLYAVALKAGIATIALRSTILIAMTIAVSIILIQTLLTRETDTTKNPEVTISIQISVFTALSMLLLSWYLISLSAGKIIASSDNIEQSTRVNVDLRWGDSMKCVSVIAGVSDYLFIWDFETSKPTVLSRTNVTRVEYTIEQQPPFVMMLLRDKSGKKIIQRTRKRSLENQKDLDEWKAKLLKVCNQKLNKEENSDITLPPQPIKKIGIE